jgi:hypothetical protein
MWQTRVYRVPSHVDRGVRGINRYAGRMGWVRQKGVVFPIRFLFRTGLEVSPFRTAQTKAVHNVHQRKKSTPRSLRWRLDSLAIRCVAGGV